MGNDLRISTGVNNNVNGRSSICIGSIRIGIVRSSSGGERHHALLRTLEFSQRLGRSSDHRRRRTYALISLSLSLLVTANSTTTAGLLRQR